MTIIITFCFVAWSEPNPKQTISQSKSGELPAQKNSNQEKPTTEIITPQVLVDAISRAIDASTQKAKTTQNPPPPDNSTWWFSLFLVIFTGALAFVAAFQFFILRSTLKETQKAADAAIKSAEVAIQNTNIAKDALISSQKAFVFVKEISATRIPSSPVNADSWRVTAILENTGGTPTKHLMMDINWKSFTGGLPDDFTFPDSNKNPFHAFIGPKGIIHSIHVDIPSALIEPRIKREDIYVWGWVDYNDVFNDTPRHRTEFCYKICYEIIKPGGIPEHYMSFQMHRKYNAADDECYRKPSPYVPPI